MYEGKATAELSGIPEEKLRSRTGDEQAVHGEETRGTYAQSGPAETRHDRCDRLRRQTERTDLEDGGKGQGGAVKILLIIGLVLLVLLDYAVCIMAHDADERAEKLYREWKEERDE